MKKILTFLLLSLFLLSGCLQKNNSEDVLKITSEKKFNKDGKALSLTTGIDLLESGKVDDAVKFFNEYEDFFAKKPEYYYYLGQAYIKKNLYQKASASFEKSLELDNRQYNLFLNIAEAYEKANNNNKATENYINYVFKSNDTSKNIEIRNKLNKLAAPITGNNIIGRVSLTNKADIIKKSTIGIMQAFNPDTSVIFASVELINAKQSDIIQTNWNFINAKEEIIPVNSSKFSNSGSETILLSIKNPIAGWPTGKYEIEILVNGIKNSTLNFYIF